LGSAVSDAATHRRRLLRVYFLVWSQLGSAVSDAATAFLESLRGDVCQGLNWAAPFPTLQLGATRSNSEGRAVSIGQRRFRRCNANSSDVFKDKIKSLNWAAPFPTLQLFLSFPPLPWRKRSQLGSAVSDAATWRVSWRMPRPRRVSIGQRRFRRCNPRAWARGDMDAASQLGSAVSDAATYTHSTAASRKARLNWAAPFPTLQQKNIIPWGAPLCVSIGQRRFRRCNIFFLQALG